MEWLDGYKMMQKVMICIYVCRPASGSVLVVVLRGDIRTEKG